MHVTVDIDWQVMGQPVMVGCREGLVHHKLYFLHWQILMSAWITMEVVIISVQTALAHLNAAVSLDTFYLTMALLVLV